MRSVRWAASLAVAGFLASGCNSDPDAAIALVPVKGVVTLNGKPLANATVQFIPDPTNKGGTAGGDTTGPEGNYMASYRSRSGLAPGKYHVTITPGVPEAEAANVSEAFKNDPFMAAEGARAAVASKPAGPKAPDVKGEFDVEVDGKSPSYDFDVKAKAAAAATATKGAS